MAKQYKTPGVYVEEKNSFGSSIISNETAIPVFIGFTEFSNQSNGEPLNTIYDSDIVSEPVLIQSMLEYEQIFGGADTTGDIMVQKNPNTGVYTAKNKKNEKPYTPGFMHPSVSNFFANGGGSCYVISLGTYQDFDNTVKASDVTSSMFFIKKAILQAETITLILPTDLIRFGAANYYTWGTQFINFSKSQKKYFTVMDVIQSDPTNPVFDEDDILNYREHVNPDFPSYAGAYFPYLKSLTAYAYKSDLSNVYLDGSKLIIKKEGENIYQGILEDVFTATFKSKDEFPTITIAEAIESSIVITNGNAMAIAFKADETKVSMNDLWNSISAEYPDWSLEFIDKPSVEEVVYNQLGMWKNGEPNAFPFFVIGNEAQGIENGPTETMTATIAVSGNKTVVVVNKDTITINVPEGITPIKALTLYNPKNSVVQLAVNPSYISEEMTTGDTVELPLITITNATIEDVKTFLATNYINMPTSPFMAGIYSRLDNATGVWTPPANVSPTGVTEPVVSLTNKQQENLNVDPIAGKSVNAIRGFTGKGTLVWGARTNDGNSLDWRYVNVRRLFISMETDISIALEAYVFKPNVHNTWVEIKTMIESYLFGLYNQGAFAGMTPETSYQVLIGQGVTMTEEDILNGYVRVSIQVAPVRPAEFIVLTFSQLIGQ